MSSFCTPYTLSLQQTSDGIFQVTKFLEDNLHFFESFRKIALTTCLRKARRGRDSSPSSLLLRYNTHAPWRTISTIQTNGNNHHFFIRIPILGHILVHFVDKTHVLVVTVELIWLMFLNIFSFDFIPTPNKALRFTRFRRSYVNRPAVVLTNHCQSYTDFWFDVRCLNWPCSFAFAAVWPQLKYICVTYFFWAHVLLQCC